MLGVDVITVEHIRKFAQQQPWQYMMASPAVDSGQEVDLQTQQECTNMVPLQLTGTYTVGLLVTFHNGL